VTTERDRHGDEHSEQVYLYALRALAPHEMAAAQAKIAGCAECRREIDALKPVVDAMTAWPTDVLRPSSSLWNRLAHRLAAETGTEPLAPPAERWDEPAWEEVAPGISCKLLATDASAHRVSMLVRLVPNGEYPPHRHTGVEELHLLHGELWIGKRKLYPGDFYRAEAGTFDTRVWSETGCTCVLMSSTRDVLG
jgi:hypothetical protein